MSIFQSIGIIVVSLLLSLVAVVVLYLHINYDATQRIKDQCVETGGQLLTTEHGTICLTIDGKLF